MELYTWNLEALLPLVLLIGVILVIHYRTGQRQAKAFALIKESLDLYKASNQKLHLVVQELRGANRYLAELVGIEEGEISHSLSDTNEQGSAEALKPTFQHKLYVGNIDYSATETELGDYFSQFGEIELINIPVNRYTGKTRGFGFIKFVSKADAEKAMEALHGTEFKGRQIHVNFAKERDSDS